MWSQSTLIASIGTLLVLVVGPASPHYLGMTQATMKKEKN